jgi:hypothetical protein
MKPIDGPKVGLLGVVLAVSVYFLGVVTVSAQSGGAYQLDQSVTCSGGGQSAGAGFSLVGTAGQTFAGTNSIGGGRAVRGGFWQPSFSPTAAPVSISGRVVTAFGVPVNQARVVLHDGLTPIPRAVLTGPFGFFQFDDVAVGRIYVLSVSSKRSIVEPVSVFVQGDVTDLVLTAGP